jgi:hypothetical protein
MLGQMIRLKVCVFCSLFVQQLCAHLFGNFVLICSATLCASVRQLCAHLFGNFVRISSATLRASVRAGLFAF